MNWKKKEISIQASKRGFSLITKEIIKQLPFIENYNIGILHLFIKHTSASITINENCDSTVRNDLKTHFDKMVPEQQKYYTHIFEGPDDMPAHIKSSIIGNNLNIPISNGKLDLGVWQGIYLCEHRNYGGNRMLVLTIYDGS